MSTADDNKDAMSTADDGKTELPIPVKVVLLGGMNIGAKSTLLEQFIFGKVDQYLSQSPGISAKKIVECNGLKFQLEIWGLFIIT